MPFKKGISGNISTQFKPGKSGNPKGRDKKLPKLDELLDKVLGEEKDDITAAEAILMRLRASAMRHDNQAAKILFERAYGKPKQEIDANITASVNTQVHLVFNNKPRQREKPKLKEP